MPTVALSHPVRAALRAPAADVPVSLTALVALALVLALALADGPGETNHALLHGVAVGVPILVGLHACRRPRTARFGRVLIAAGVVWSLSALAESSASVPYSGGRVAAWLIQPILLYVMLAFPEGRIVARTDRVIFASAVGLIAVLFVGAAPFVEAYPLDTPWASCRADCPPNAFLALDREPAVMQDVVVPARELLSVAVMAAVTWSLLRRIRTASRAWGRQVLPVMVACVVSCGVLVAFLAIRRLAPGSPAAAPLGVAWALSIPAIAVAFFVGQMHRRLQVADILERLSVALRAAPDARGLRRSLAEAVEDPVVELLLPTDKPGTWRDSRGGLTSVAETRAQGLHVTAIGDEPGPVAMLVHDPALRDDDELLQAVCDLSLAALRHQQLRVRLESALGQLEESRKRIVRAADLERSRIERDLHDGAQQRLIALRIKLSLALDLLQSDPAAGLAKVAELGADIEVAMEELRAIAHGVYPALLTDRGLADALGSVAAEATKPVHLHVHGLTRLAPEIETAVYFTCREALQNAIKHAGCATAVWVTLRQGDGLRFEVRDDGPGFLPPGEDVHGGLRNMRDRIEAIGGRLTIDTAPGHGTRVIGVIPLR